MTTFCNVGSEFSSHPFPSIPPFHQGSMVPATSLQDLRTVQQRDDSTRDQDCLSSNPDAQQHNFALLSEFSAGNTKHLMCSDVPDTQRQQAPLWAQSQRRQQQAGAPYLAFPAANAQQTIQMATKAFQMHQQMQHALGKGSASFPMPLDSTLEGDVSARNHPQCAHGSSFVAPPLEVEIEQQGSTLCGDVGEVKGKMASGADFGAPSVSNTVPEDKNAAPNQHDVGPAASAVQAGGGYSWERHAEGAVTDASGRNVAGGADCIVSANAGSVSKARRSLEPIGTKARRSIHADVLEQGIAQVQQLFDTTLSTTLINEGLSSDTAAVVSSRNTGEASGIVSGKHESNQQDLKMEVPGNSADDAKQDEGCPEEDVGLQGEVLKLGRSVRTMAGNMAAIVNKVRAWECLPMHLRAHTEKQKLLILNCTVMRRTEFS